MNSSNGEIKPAVERIIRLNAGVFRLDRQDQTIRVVYGYAWVTMGKQDIFLTKGEEVHISAKNGNVIIQALKHRPLLFQIYPN